MIQSCPQDVKSQDQNIQPSSPRRSKNRLERRSRFEIEAFKIENTSLLLLLLLLLLHYYYYVVRSFCAVAATVPPRPEDRRCSSHRTLHHSVQLCDKRELNIAKCPCNGPVVKCLLKLHTDITLLHMTTTTTKTATCEAQSEKTSCRFVNFQTCQTYVQHDRLHS